MSSTTRYDARFWGRYFRSYDALNASGPYQDLLDRVAELSALRPGDRAVDIGAGTGNLLSRLRGSDASVLALDANPIGLARAARKAPTVPLLLATLEHPLPFRDGSFHVVTAVNVLYALSTAGLGTCLREVRRVLRPGGRLVFSVPAAGSSIARIYAASIRRWRADEGLVTACWRTARLIAPTVSILLSNLRISRNAERGSYHFFNENELSEVMGRAGLHLSRIERAYADQAWLGVASVPATHDGDPS